MHFLSNKTNDLQTFSKFQYLYSYIPSIELNIKMREIVFKNAGILP